MAKNYLSDEHRILAKIAQKCLNDEQKIKWILKKWDRKVWIGLLWPRLRPEQSSRALMNAIIILRFPQNAGNFLTR